MSAIADPVASVSTKRFLGRRAEDEAALAGLSAEAQAALRQFTAERLIGYGVAPADVVELRAAVVDGRSWRDAATDLAATMLAQAEAARSDTTRVACLRRASALVRMSQVMMLDDGDARRAIFAQAAALYGQAAALSGDRQPYPIDSEGGVLAGWLHPARRGAVASAIVIGGVEGWAMDFASIGEALAARGVDALMLDGPGQGESRFAHRHYLTTRWRSAYRAAIDALARRAPGHAIGIVGNSMGGSFAMAMAAADPRLRACCDNGGAPRPIEARDKPSFFAKMMAACGTTDEAVAVEAWESVDPLSCGENADYALLIVQGGGDPLVSTDAARALLDGAATADKEMVVFSDGDHCIYNHRDDRDALIADWMRARLAP